jgi:hypothetical protein
MDRAIDGTSVAAMKRNIDRLHGELTPAQKGQLDTALVAVALRSAFTRVLGAGFAGDTSSAAMQRVMLAEVNGKTPRQLIDAWLKARALPGTPNEAPGAAASEPELPHEASAPPLSEQTKPPVALPGVLVTDARFYWEKDEFESKPIISFRVLNKAGYPIKTIFAHGTVATPGRAIPWIDEDFNYEFAGGLENGESKRLQLAPNPFSKWGEVETKGRSDLVLTITVVDAEGADGRRVSDAQK